MKTRGAMFTGGASGNSTRQEDDFYATPPLTTELFLKEFKKEGGLIGDILECSCGMGHMAKVIQVVYPNSTISCTDLVYRGYGEGGIDFLNHDYEKKFDTIITNPPFKIAKEFIEKGLEISNKYVIMLMKIQFLESVSRKEFLQNSPLKYVYVHSSRQSCWMGGEEINPKTGKQWSGAMMLAWYVFDKEYKGEPIIRWI